MSKYISLFNHLVIEKNSSLEDQQESVILKLDLMKPWP